MSKMLSLVFLLVGAWASLKPLVSIARTVDLGVHVESIDVARKRIALANLEIYADKKVYVAGRCVGDGSMSIFLVDVYDWADEVWWIEDNERLADMTICLSGDIQDWNDNAR